MDVDCNGCVILINFTPWRLAYGGRKATHPSRTSLISGTKHFNGQVVISFRKAYYKPFYVTYFLSVENLLPLATGEVMWKRSQGRL